MKSNSKKTRIIRIVGNAFTIICLAFIAWSLLRLDISWKAYFLNWKNYCWLVILSFISLIHYIPVILAWQRLLVATSGVKISFGKAYYVYSRANIAKYIPGNVMQFAGRNILGSYLGIKQGDIAYATVLEIVVSLVSAFVVAAALSSSYILDSFKILVENKAYKFTAALVLILIVSIIIVLIVISLKKPKFKEYILKIFTRKSFHSIMNGTLFYIVSSLIWSVMNVLIFTSALTVKLTVSQAATVSGLSLISWIVGFIVPGSPGGIGIREAIMVLLMEPIIGGGRVAVGAVLLRIINVISDLLLYFLGLIVYKKQTSESRI